VKSVNRVTAFSTVGYCSVLPPEAPKGAVMALTIALTEIPRQSLDGPQNVPDAPLTIYPIFNLNVCATPAGTGSTHIPVPRVTRSRVCANSHDICRNGVANV